MEKYCFSCFLLDYHPPEAPPPPKPPPPKPPPKPPPPKLPPLPKPPDEPELRPILLRMIISQISSPRPLPPPPPLPPLFLRLHKIMRMTIKMINGKRASTGNFLPLPKVRSSVNSPVNTLKMASEPLSNPL